MLRYLFRNKYPQIAAESAAIWIHKLALDRIAAESAAIVNIGMGYRLYLVHVLVLCVSNYIGQISMVLSPHRQLPIMAAMEDPNGSIYSVRVHVAGAIEIECFRSSDGQGPTESITIAFVGGGGQRIDGFAWEIPWECLRHRARPSTIDPVSAAPRSFDCMAPLFPLQCLELTLGYSQTFSPDSNWQFLFHCGLGDFQRALCKNQTDSVVSVLIENWLLVFGLALIINCWNVSSLHEPSCNLVSKICQILYSLLA